MATNFLSAYNGRKTDLLLVSVRDNQLGDTAPASTAVYGPHGQTYRIAGIRKLTQRFLVLLFTPLGEDPAFPGYGCSFLRDSQSGIWQNASDVRRDFNASLLDILPQLRSLQRADDPADEQVKSISLTDVILNADQLALSVSLSAQSQGTNELLIPILTQNSAA